MDVIDHINMRMLLLAANLNEQEKNKGRIERELIAKSGLTEREFWSKFRAIGQSQYRSYSPERRDHEKPTETTRSFLHRMKSMDINADQNENRSPNTYSLLQRRRLPED